MSGAIAQPNPRTDARATFPVDPKTVVVLAVPSRNVDAWLAEKFIQFYGAFVQELGTAEGLNVIPPERALPFLGSLLPEEEIGRQLGAGTVVALGINTDESPEFTFRYIDVATGKARGGGGLSQLDRRSAAELRADVARIVEQ